MVNSILGARASVAPRAAELANRLPGHAPGELLVKLKPESDVDHFVQGGLLARFNQDGALPFESLEHLQMPAVMRQNFGGELLRLKLPAEISTAEGIALLEGDPRLAFVTSNDLRTASKLPNDELYGDLWGLDKIQAPSAWDQTVGQRKGPVIAVLDTGLDVSHPDLKANLWTNPGEIPGNGIDDDGNGVVDDIHGYNAVDQTGDPLMTTVTEPIVRER